MEIIEQIGSYAGLAAIVGLAVLAALYFSQARDLRRLRQGEEAGGASAASEAPGEHRGPQRPTAAAVPGTATAASNQASAGHAVTATQARPAPAAEGGEATAEAAGAERKAAEGATPAVAGAKPAAPAPATPTGGDNGDGQGTPPHPAAPRLPAPRPGATATALRSGAAPASAPATAARPWHKRLAPRYLALILAGVLVVSAGAAYAIAALVGEDDAAPTTEAGTRAGGTQPLDPSTITVAVLNGTEVSGLAAQVADTVESAGFQRGNVANATEQASAESAVLFAEGARGPARQVGQELDIPQIEPIDDTSAALAGTADVVVVVGADQAE